jgi:type I restriction enzyme, S subunit
MSLLLKPVPLRQLAVVLAGQPAPKDDEFADHGVPFVRAGSLADLLSGKPESELELVSDDIARLRKLKVYPAGTILFAKSGMSATKDRVYALRKPAYVVSHLAALIPNESAHGDYLRLALKHFPPSTLIKDPAYPSIGLDEIKGYEILIPEDRNDQIRIARLLSKVEGLIVRRKQQLAQLDALLKSVFLEMFGDPVRNEKGWDKVQFSELLDRIESGTSPKCVAREATTDEWGVLKLGAVTRCAFDATENKALPQGVSPSVRDEVKAGDLLFSRKNTYELVAACAYVYETRSMLLMPDLIFRLVFKDTAEVNKIFMWKLLTNDSQRKAIQSLAAGAAGSMPNISKTNLKTVQLPTPPLPLQDHFASIVEKIEALKSRYRHSLTDLETLYSALSQSAFKGELDLSRIPLPASALEPTPMEDDTTIAVDLEVPASPLPDLGLTAEALANEAGRLALLTTWLDAWQTHLDTNPFVLPAFLDAAQTRLQTLYPESELELGMAAYEQIKDWVFAALDGGQLMQEFEPASKRITLKRAHA